MQQIVRSLKDTNYVCSYFSFPPVCYIGFWCMCEDLEGLERELFFPTETQLLNDSSAVPPLIL